MNLKDQLLALKGRIKVEAVQIDGMTEPVFVKTMTGKERDAFEASCFVQKGKNREFNTQNLRAKLLTRTICDAEGVRLFGDHEADLLGDMPSDVLDALFTAAQKLSGLAASDVEEMVGN